MKTLETNSTMQKAQSKSDKVKELITMTPEQRAFLIMNWNDSKVLAVIFQDLLRQADGIVPTAATYLILDVKEFLSPFQIACIAGNLAAISYHRGFKEGLERTMKTLQRNIRKIAQRKTVVQITSKKRAKRGFCVLYPDGKTYNCPTRREALTHLLIAMRCEATRHWRITTSRPSPPSTQFELPLA